MGICDRSKFYAVHGWWQLISGVYSADIKSCSSNAHPPMESGKYISWFSSTFSAVSFFSEPTVKKERHTERESERIKEMQLGVITDYHLLLHRKEGYPLQHLIGLIHTVINAVICSRNQPWLWSAMRLDSSDLISFTHRHYFVHPLRDEIKEV